MKRASAGGALLLAAAVFVIYRPAIGSFFFNDDFNWFDQAQRFSLANFFHLDRYDHFYRPIIEIYFYAGRALFGCAALPFHLVSVGLHLLNTFIVYLFARDFSGRRDIGMFSALFFCTQPGYYEAVSWVAAMTDLLPGVWYLLTLWLFLRFLGIPEGVYGSHGVQHGSRRGNAGWYVCALLTFMLCLLTHETSATLLPMLMALDITMQMDAREPFDAAAWLRASVPRYMPFVVLLAGSLTIAVVVNSRSYLIREGHYQFGWHAVPHMLQFILSLSIARRSMTLYALIAAVTALLLWRGSRRVRFAVVMLFATLAPASFFTWGNASRYLYVPAAAFALLLAHAIIAIETMAAHRMSPGRARALAALVAVALAIRFSIYAEKSARSFRDLTLPYERFVAAVQHAHPDLRARLVALTADDVEHIPVAYHDVAAGAAFCGPPIHVVVP